MKKLLIIILLAVCISGGYYLYQSRQNPPAPVNPAVPQPKSAPVEPSQKDLLNQYLAQHPKSVQEIVNELANSSPVDTASITRAREHWQNWWKEYNTKNE